MKLLSFVFPHCCHKNRIFKAAIIRSSKFWAFTVAHFIKGVFMIPQFFETKILTAKIFKRFIFNFFFVAKNKCVIYFYFIEIYDCMIIHL